MGNDGVFDTGFYGTRLAVPVGVNGAGLWQYGRLMNMPMEQIRMAYGAAHGAEMEALRSAYGLTIRVTNRREKIYRQGLPRRRLLKATTQSRPRFVRGEVIGHALPYSLTYIGIELTDMGGRLLTEPQIIAGCAEAAENLVAVFPYDYWERITSPDEVEHDVGTSVGWYNGTAGSVDARPTPGVTMQSFPSTHSHYLRETTNKGLINALVKTIVEHKQPAGGRVMVIVSEADRDAIKGLGQELVAQIPVGVSISAGSSNITYRNTPIGAYGVFQKFGEWLGSVEVLVDLYATPVLPSGWMVALLSYGAMNPNNPVDVYHDPRFVEGFGPVMMPQNRVSALFPFDTIMSMFEFGVGVNMRDRGAAGKVAASGDYTKPTLNLG